MKLNDFKTAAVWIMTTACFLWPLRATAQFGFGKLEAQPPATMPKPAPLTHHFELYYDGQMTAYAFPKKDVIAPQELQQTPIYENAPFLRLKPGDKLCTGVEHFAGKGESLDVASYYVQHDGKYYELDKVDNHKKLHLWNARLSLLFDWDLSLATAGQLRQIYGPRPEVSLAPEKYQDLKNALRQKFPDIECEDGEITVRQPFLEGQGELRHAVFEGVAFNSYANVLYQYRLQIGPQMFQEYRKNLIVGPPHIERKEFEGQHDNGYNAGPQHTLDAQTAAMKRAAYERMLAFIHIIQPFLPGGDRVGATEGFGF